MEAKKIMEDAGKMMNNETLFKSIVQNTLCYPEMMIQSRLLYSHLYTNEIHYCKPYWDTRNQSIRDISRSIQDAAQITGLAMIRVSNNILMAANSLSNSIDRIENEMERFHKQDEYYMLLDKIDMYEDFLIKREMLQDTYQKIRLTEIPIISLKPEMIAMISLEFGEEKEAIEGYIKNTYEHPLVSLADIFIIKYTTEYALYHNKDCFSDKILKECEELSKKQNEEKIGAKTHLINEFLKEFDTRARKYTDIRYQMTNEYIKLKSLIDIINRDRCLANLRNLYCNLRLAVREIKISG